MAQTAMEINTGKFKVITGISIIGCIFLAYLVVFNVYSIINNTDVSELSLPEYIAVSALTEESPNNAAFKQQISLLKKYYHPDPMHPEYLYIDPNVSEEQKILIKDNLISLGYYSDLSSTDRDVETDGKMFFNGNLGQFFRFKLLGNLNWLAIPLLLYGIVTIRKRKRWEIAFFLYYIVSVILIFKDPYNYRYQMTNQPITLALIFYLINEITSNVFIRKYKSIILVSILILVLINSFKAFIVLNKENNNYLTGNISTENKDKESQLKDHPTKTIFDFINNMPSNSHEWFVVNNLSEFYYYTDKPGLYCWFGNWMGAVTCYWENNKIVVMNPDSDTIDKTPTPGINIKYILHNTKYDAYNNKMVEFLRRRTDIIYTAGDYVIYQIK